MATRWTAVGLTAPLRFRQSPAVVALLALGSLLPILLIQWFPELFYRAVALPAYLLFHNIAELFSVIVAISIFGMAWYTFDRSKDRYTLFMGAVFLTIGLLDFMHMLGYAGMPAFITDNSANKSTQYWIAARLFMAVALLASVHIHPDSSAPWLSKPLLMTASFTITLAVFVAITFFPQYVPDTFVPGAGLTGFKKGTEYLIITLLVLAAAGYWRRIAQSHESSMTYGFAALILCAIAEFCFAGYASVFDSYNVLGHIYKVGAFFLFYEGIATQVVSEPYDRLQAEVAERTEAERALQKAQRLLEETQQITKVGGWEYDLRSGKLTWTDEVYRIYGVPRDEDPTRLLSDGIHPFAGQGAVATAFQRALTEGVPYDIEARLENAEGRSLWVHTVGLVERQGGAVVRVYGILLDITARKEAALEREQYFKLFNASTDLMGIADPNGAFKRVNPAFTATLGWSTQELLAQPFLEFVHPDDRQATVEEVASQLRRGYSLDFENRYLCKDGSVRWLSWRAYVNYAEGLTYATARDVTEAKRIQEELRRQSAELRLRNDELESFNEAMVGRELAMIDLKRQINTLAAELGREPPFPLNIFEQGSAAPGVKRDVTDPVKSVRGSTATGV